jgi:hypothetical protein
LLGEQKLQKVGRSFGKSFFSGISHALEHSEAVKFASEAAKEEHKEHNETQSAPRFFSRPPRIFASEDSETKIISAKICGGQNFNLSIQPTSAASGRQNFASVILDSNSFIRILRKSAESVANKSTL